MHFFKLFTALATVAFGASCAIAVPLGDTGSAPTPETTGDNGHAFELIYANSGARGVITGVDLSVPDNSKNVPVPVDMAAVSAGGLSQPSTQVRRADADDLAQALYSTTEKLDSVKDQFKSITPSTATGSNAESVKASLRIINILLSASNDVQALSVPSPNGATAVGSDQTLANAFINIVATALALSAGVLGAMANIMAKQPISVLAVPLLALLSVVNTVSSVLIPFLKLVV